MKIVLQRVLSASVKIDGFITGKIEHGLLVYVCFESHDEYSAIDKAIKKIMALRIFQDKHGKMNKNILETSGEILSISQFTLSWDGRKGNRPSFDLSMPPQKAADYYKKFNKKIDSFGVHIQTGTFGADMKVESINDGPVTFHLSF